MGWVDLVVASIWGLLWAMFAAAAGLGLAAAATTLFRRDDADLCELGGGYNALAPVVDR
jgi:hypothetical protein